MGQYFQLVNLDRMEIAQLPGLMKAVERVTDVRAMGLVGYLLLQGPQDGTMFVGINADVDDIGPEELENIAPDRDPQSAVRIIESKKDIGEANEYAGRWAGDRVALVGDYDESGLYGDSSLTDITDGLVAEFTEFVGEEWWEGDHQDQVMRPDMVLTRDDE